MKKYIFILILISSITADAQSLKDALFSGKLKTDSGTVIRKGDDLSSKIDTAKKKPVDSSKTKLTLTTRDSSKATVNTPTDPATNPATNPVTPVTPVTDNVAATDNTTSKDNVTPKDNAAPKDNNKIWKVYIDSLTSTLKAEALPSKKIKSGTYYIFMEYEIGVDGQTTLNNVSCSPENSFIEQQIKERFSLTAPQMNPVLGGNGKPRKVVKKYNLTLSKM